MVENKKTIVVYVSDEVAKTEALINSIKIQQTELFQIVFVYLHASEELLLLLQKQRQMDARIRFCDYTELNCEQLEGTLCFLKQQSPMEYLELQDREHNSNTKRVLNYILLQLDILNSIRNTQYVFEKLHRLFQQPEYRQFTIEDFESQSVYQNYYIIRENEYDKVKELGARRRIVSMTSYPQRIPTLHRVIESLLHQTMKADQIILWLAESQFPGKESDLSKELRELEASGQLTIRWCEDLRSHKKYYYALQEFKEDLLITVDDDLIYKDRMIEILYLSYLMYPECVSAMRAHLIAITPEGKLLPYDYWIKEFRQWLLAPSMQLFATSGAGTLYPPGCMNDLVFDFNGIMDTCMYADDLWLKVMQVLNNTPVVLAQKAYGLNNVEGTQEETLYEINVLHGKNDVQLAAINQFVDQRAGEQNCFLKKIVDSPYKETFAVGSELFYGIFSAERERNHKERKHLRKRIQYLEEKRGEISEVLQRTYGEKSEINRKLQITYKEKADRGLEIKELKAKIDELIEKNTLLEEENKKLKDSKMHKIGTFFSSRKKDEK